MKVYLSVYPPSEHNLTNVAEEALSGDFEVLLVAGSSIRYALPADTLLIVVNFTLSALSSGLLYDAIKKLVSRTETYKPTIKVKIERHVINITQGNEKVTIESSTTSIECDNVKSALEYIEKENDFCR